MRINGGVNLLKVFCFPCRFQALIRAHCKADNKWGGYVIYDIGRDDQEIRLLCVTSCLMTIYTAKSHGVMPCHAVSAQFRQVCQPVWHVRHCQHLHLQNNQCHAVPTHFILPVSTRYKGVAQCCLRNIILIQLYCYLFCSSILTASKLTHCPLPIKNVPHSSTLSHRLTLFF